MTLLTQVPIDCVLWLTCTSSSFLTLSCDSLESSLKIKMQAMKMEYQLMNGAGILLLRYGNLAAARAAIINQISLFFAHRREVNNDEHFFATYTYVREKTCERVEGGRGGGEGTKDRTRA